MLGGRAGAEAKPHAGPHPFDGDGRGLTFLRFNVHERPRLMPGPFTRVYAPKDSRKAWPL